MPDIVNEDDLSALAGEYVLGTLDPTERARANVLLDVDQRFRGLVRVWELRFGELHLMVEPVTPDAKVWQRIRGKLGIGPREPAPPPPPPPPAPPTAMARADAPAAAKPELSKRDEITAADVKAAEAELDQVETALFEPDEIEPEEARPKRELADLIEEVERYTETMKGKARPPEPALAEAAPALKPEPAAADAAATPKLESAKPEPAKLEPAKLELAKPAEAEPEIAEAAAPKEEPDEEDEAAKEMQRILRDAAARDAAAAALVAVEEAREHLRRRPQEPRPRGWGSVALLMTIVAASLSGLIAAWRFAPDHLPAPLRPMAVLNIPESPLERQPAPHGTEFEE